MRRNLPWLVLLLVLRPAAPAHSQPQIIELTVDGDINPASANYIARGLHEASARGAALVIIKLDTPGGLMVSMKQIDNDILGSPVPVGVWVAPQGAQAASAGTFLVYAAHISAMAPSTVIGSAHPVFVRPGSSSDQHSSQMDTMERKVLNNAAAQIRALATQRGRNAAWAERAVRQSVSVTADEAVKLHIVDFIATSPQEFAQKADGRQVQMSTGKQIVKTAGATVVPLQMSWRESILGTIGDPNIAYLLLVIGFYAIVLELKAPHFGGLGIIGITCLVLALYALSVLPFNWAGLALMLLGIGCLVAELYVPTHGALSAGGLASFIIGSLILIDVLTMEISRPLIAGVAAGTALFFLVALAAIVRSQKRPAVVGRSALVGRVGHVRQRLEPEGMVYVDGALWSATTDEPPVEVGEAVEVVEEAAGMTLKVRHLPAPEEPSG